MCIRDRYGIATIFIIIAYIIVAASAVKSSYKLELLKEKGKHINTFAEDVKSLFNENLHKLLLTLPVSGVLIFTILPLIFMISMAFTNYSKVDSHLVLFDWVGLENFKQIFDSGSMIEPVSYTHLDVYKRQSKIYYQNHNPKPL